MRRILGIDPGLRVTGFGILEARGSELVYISSGCIRATGSSLPVRLGVIVRDLAAVIAGLPVSEYTAGQVKQAVVGAGRALKPQVQEMVRRLLSLPGLPATDAADALAAAICHAHASTGIGALARNGYRVRGGRLLVT